MLFSALATLFSALFTLFSALIMNATTMVPTTAITAYMTTANPASIFHLEILTLCHSIISAAHRIKD
jgi:hypothetical protein